MSLASISRTIRLVNFLTGRGDADGPSHYDVEVSVDGGPFQFHARDAAHLAHRRFESARNAAYVRGDNRIAVLAWRLVPAHLSGAPQ